MNNTTNDSGFCIKSLGDILDSDPRFVKGPDLPDCRIPKGSVAVLLSECVPLFLAAIFCIILGSTKKEMFRIHAGGIIAGMADHNMAWNYRIVDFKGKSMGHRFFSVYPESSVATRIPFASPQPTISRFFDLEPKTLDKWPRMDLAAFLRAANSLGFVLPKELTADRASQPFFGVSHRHEKDTTLA